MELFEKTKTKQFDEYKTLFDTIINSEASPRPQIIARTSSLLPVSTTNAFQPPGLFGCNSSINQQSCLFGGAKGNIQKFSALLSK